MREHGLGGGLRRRDHEHGAGAVDAEERRSRRGMTQAMHDRVDRRACVRRLGRAAGPRLE
jgi:hypothetical protein